MASSRPIGWCNARASIALSVQRLHTHLRVDCTVRARDERGGRRDRALASSCCASRRPRVSRRVRRKRRILSKTRTTARARLAACDAASACVGTTFEDDTAQSRRSGAHESRTRDRRIHHGSEEEGEEEGDQEGSQEGQEGRQEVAPSTGLERGRGRSLSAVPPRVFFLCGAMLERAVHLHGMSGGGAGGAIFPNAT